MVTKDKTTETILKERLRISAILESPDGVKHPTMARELALRSNFQPDQALHLMRSVPAESQFADAMDAIGSVGIAGALSPNGLHVDPKEARKAQVEAAASSYAKTRGYRRG